MASTYDPERVRNIVREVMDSEFGLAFPSVVWRFEDDPSINQAVSTPAQFQGFNKTLPLVLINTGRGYSQRDEVGGSGQNSWSETYGVMFHIYDDRRKDFADVRAIDAKIVALFEGRHFGEDFRFTEPRAPYMDEEGAGTDRGQSRVIEYEYEYTNR